ncbi:hypothetical protein GCM10027164_16130 [Algoriphagus taiwanensis]|uniref:DUF493 domain-containing protein n=2 Tax=Algoriphagus taiwanensis TaxID=1445656 RepID=A0ABQ6Q6J9_9BACT|nr:hypothetical protein Ataiwa_33960 [Algoriphagus taiwanensis]
MDMANETSIPKFSYPGLYSIRVSGKIQKDLLEYFQGIEKSVVEVNDTGNSITHLAINIRDQAELIGLLNMLYEWQHVLISVKLGENYSTV